MLPIYIIGTKVLRQVGQDVPQDYPGLQQFIDLMFESMYQSDGVGLAAPQVGKSLKLFVVDATPYADDFPEARGFKRVFINAKIIEYSGKDVTINEGCLSIPGVREDVVRKDTIKIQYYDRNFEFHEEIITGLPARVVQHEYDHTYGILFTDRLSQLKRTMLRNKLRAIARGKFKVNYKYVLGDKNTIDRYLRPITNAFELA